MSPVATDIGGEDRKVASPSVTAPSTNTRTSKVLALSLGNALTMLANIAFGMIAARCLSKHDYATIRQTFLAYDFAAPLLMLGLPNALYYFLPRSGGNQRGTIVDNIALLFLGGLLFSLFILCGGHQLLASRFDNPDLQRTIPWLSVYPLLMMPVAGIAAALVCTDRTRVLAVYNVASSLLLTISGIIAILVTRSYEFPILVRIIVPALFLPVALYLMFSKAPGSLRLPQWEPMKQMVHYSVPLGMATMLGSITLQMDSLIVASLCTPDDFAVYVNGAMEIPVIGIVTGSITTVVFAEMAEMCARGDRTAALELFHKASIKSACILFPSMCFFLATALPFVTFMYSEQYAGSVTPFVIYLFVLPVRVVVYGAALMALGMTRVILVRSIIDLLINGILCVLLVKMFGLAGAAFAIIVTLYFWTVPFNLKKIAEGFGVSWKQSLPFGMLSKILALCFLCMPLAYVGSLVFHGNLLGKLLLDALLYWPAVAYLLFRFKFVSLPPVLKKLLPAAQGLP